MPFIDAALQSLGRTGILEISATDTAALCGSSNTSAKRRYGIIGVVDQVRHDTAIRVLLSQVAQIAARHDRVVESNVAKSSFFI